MYSRQSTYHRTKKYRSLKCKRLPLMSDTSVSSTSSESVSTVSTNTDYQNNKVSEQIGDLVDVVPEPENRKEESRRQSTTSSEIDNQDIEPSSNTEKRLLFIPEAYNFRSKLVQWATKNVNHLPHSVINELLEILRLEGHLELPKDAETLLCTKRTDGVIRKLETSKPGKFGDYIYCGIKSGLKSRLSHSNFDEDTINVIVNIDDLPLFNKSKISMTPILMQIIHQDYRCNPFEVALYAGPSKPSSRNAFLDDFLEEVSHLIENGVVIDEKRYNFSLKAFICDTAARAYLKNIKGHTGFYACERCEIKGETVSLSKTNARKKSRIYPELDCKLRTKESFEQQSQGEHHLKDETSPFLRIKDFDPVRGVPLEGMHLLCEGAMKLIMYKIFQRKRITKLCPSDIRLLAELLDELAGSVPNEFQRKSFPLDDLGNWKATQYRFILLYAGAIVFRKVLPREMYRHFLLLYTACRILSDRDMAVSRVEEANALLRKFVSQMPKFYGQSSQVINIHNLIHLSDDVKYMQAPLSDYTAFDFANRLGKIKQLVRTPRNPVAQVFRRLSEMEASGNQSMSRYPLIANTERNNKCETSSKMSYSTVTVKQFNIGTTSPDNVVQLQGGEFFSVTQIYSLTQSSDINDFFARGFFILETKNLFEEPIKSEEIGVVKIKRMPSIDEERNSTTICLNRIKRKCVLIAVGKRNVIVNLLHV